MERSEIRSSSFCNKTAMKSYCTICCVAIILLASCHNGRKTEEKNIRTSIEWMDTLHHFGNIRMENPVDSFDFRFRNTGKQPLVVLHVKTSCHCTEASYPKRPVMSGEESFIRVTYNGNGRSPEYFNKTIEVHTNAGTRPVLLKIDGNLVK